MEYISKNINKNYIIPKSSGRFGNAFFRYLAYTILKLKIDKFNNDRNKSSNNNINDYDYEYISEHEYSDINDYIFYKGLDLVGHDVDFCASSLNDIKSKVFFNNNIKCFNTLGFLKDSFDINMLTSNEYINNNTVFNGIETGLYVKNYIIVDDSNFEYYISNIHELIGKNIYLYGYYQKDYIYLKYKNEIMNHIFQYADKHYLYEDNYCGGHHKYLLKDFIEPNQNKISLNDSKIYNFVMHVRLGDFNGRMDFIEFEWYEKILNRIKKEYPQLLSCKNAIIFDKINSENKEDIEYIDKCIGWFKNNNINISIESNDMLTDFHIIKNAEVVLCSMSTFAWAAVYVSNTVKLCYMPNYNFNIRLNSSSIIDQISSYFKHPIQNTILYDVKTTMPLMKKMKIVILTLKEPDYSRVNGLQELIMNLSKIGLEIEIYYGINGNDIKIYPTEDESIKLLYHQFKTIFYDSGKRINRQIMKLGELGCAWSQINIYKKLIEDCDYNQYLIFEDDAHLLKSLEELCVLLLNLPTDFDMCHIALSNWNPFEKVNKVNDYFYTIKPNYFNRCTAYILSKSGAQKVLHYTANRINMPSDDLLCHTYLNRPDFKLYVPESPYFHIMDDNKSIINKVNGDTVL